MNDRQQRFIKLLEEIFEINKSDLDFGIYRILNIKRKEIEDFFRNRLPALIEKELAPFASAGNAEIRTRIAEIEQQLGGKEIIVSMPDSVPLVAEYRKLQSKLAYDFDMAALESDVYSALYSFFNRYYEEGDFISKRRYKEGVYAIPYEGEEVKLYWANQDQYYIKTSENFKDYTFMAEDITVHFRLVDATTEQNNNKESENEKRVFMIFVENQEEYPGISTFSYDPEAKELVVRFTYDIPTDKKKKYADENYKAIVSHIAAQHPELVARLMKNTSANPKEQKPLIQKHLEAYVAKNTFDYFIHKDLKGFLSRELDFYIKNEILHIDDIDSEDVNHNAVFFAKIRAIKKVARILIDFLAQLENFQKRLWLKKKFVVETNWCITLDNIDEIIHIIRAAKNPDLAKQAMMERFSLSDAQASAIIEMRLRALTGLEHDKLVAERNELEAQIAYFNDVLGSRELQMKIVKDELLEVKAKYGDERRSEIVYASEEFNPEDFYADDEMVITISHLGYIKRTPLAEYRTQNRGGVGAKGSATRDEDFIEHIYMATMHNTMLFFTEKGRCYWLKVYEIPEGTRSSKGRAIQNVIQIEPDDKVRAYINVKRLDDAEYVNNNYIIMCTKDGTIKKTKLEAYSRPRQNGVNAIVIREGDQLIEAKLTSGSAEVMIAAREGKAIRFNENTVRPIGRVGAGVRGISLDEGDEVVGMICIEPNSSQDVLVLSENGYGKRTDLDEYRITNRGGKGVKTINITEKTGKLISIQAVTDENDLMIINRSGLTIRTAVDQIRVAGRATQGVRIINLREGDAIASVIAVPANEEEEPAVLDGAGAPESESEENVSKEQ